MATGRWLSGDPLGDQGFYSTCSATSAAGAVAADSKTYRFVENFPTGAIGGLGLVTIGFYGANIGGELNAGNRKVDEIAKAVKAQMVFRSTAVYPAYQYLSNYFSPNGPGCTNLQEPIKIFGHSWGGSFCRKTSRLDQSAPSWATSAGRTGGGHRSRPDSADPCHRAPKCSTVLESLPNTRARGDNRRSASEWEETQLPSAIRLCGPA